MLKNSSKEGTMDIKLSRLLVTIASRIDTATSDEGERLVGTLCRLKLIQIGHEKFNNFVKLSNSSKCWYIRFLGDVHTHAGDHDDFMVTKDDMLVSSTHVAELNLLVHIDHHSYTLNEKRNLRHHLYCNIVQLYGTDDSSKWSDTARLDLNQLDGTIQRDLKKNLIFLSLPEHHKIMEQLKEDELFAEELVLQKVAVDDALKKMLNRLLMTKLVYQHSIKYTTLILYLSIDQSCKLL